ncbi:MAG: pyridoxal-phosphate dependent enzyme, partial [Nitrosotalea sp.]
MATKAINDAETFLKKIGNTPVVKLVSLSNNQVEFYAKLESHNPFGSVKDRA